MSPRELEVERLRRALAREYEAMRRETRLQRRRTIENRIRGLEEALQQIEAGPQARDSNRFTRRYAALPSHEVSVN